MMHIAHGNISYSLVTLAALATLATLATVITYCVCTSNVTGPSADANQMERSDAVTQ